MSDTSELTALARFVGQSPLASSDRRVAAQTLDGLARQILPSGGRRKVTDLLAVVMALSARTRRVVMPSVEIELDVFGPDGTRAVRLQLGQ